jgi:hypothetical protein
MSISEPLFFYKFGRAILSDVLTMSAGGIPGFHLKRKKYIIGKRRGLLKQETPEFFPPF